MTTSDKDGEEKNSFSRGQIQQNFISFLFEYYIFLNLFQSFEIITKQCLNLCLYCKITIDIYPMCCFHNI
jgi:hypothetical protein